MEAVIGDRRHKTKAVEVDRSNQFTLSSQPALPVKDPKATGKIEGFSPVFRKVKKDAPKAVSAPGWRKNQSPSRAASRRPKETPAEPPKPSLHQKILLEKMEEDEQEVRDREYWKAQKAALKEKFPEGWQPRKKLSPDALAGIRALNAEFPEQYTTEVLANKFEVSPEAIRRILKSKWAPSADEEIERQERWFSRGKKVWTRYAELGKKPPRRWRKEGIVRDPIWNEKRKSRSDDDESDERRARSHAHRKLSQSLM